MPKRKQDRKPEVPAPVKVSRGEAVSVALPVKLALVPVTAVRRDTLTKDYLRAKDKSDRGYERTSLEEAVS